MPFGGGLPLSSADGPVTFCLAMCSSMVEHPMNDKGPLHTLLPPLLVLIKEDISIQQPFHPLTDISSSAPNLLAVAVSPPLFCSVGQIVCSN